MDYFIEFIRHEKTQGNLEGRYIGGKTDEPLLQASKNALISRDCTNCVLFTSPMLRCIETIQILFPKGNFFILEELREIDFGDFENKNYEELNGNFDYQKWIDSGGKSDFPNGESMANFHKRNQKSIEIILKKLKESSQNRAAVVCHGGNIMSILSQLTHEDYFSFQVKNGSGFCVKLSMKGDNIDQVSYHSISYRNPS